MRVDCRVRPNAAPLAPKPDDGGSEPPGDYLDTQTVTSVSTPTETDPPGQSDVNTTGFSNGTLIILGQGACDTGTSWLGGQIERLGCQDGNGAGKRVLIFALLTAVPNEAWTTMTVNGVEYARVDALYQNYGSAVVWTWGATTGLNSDPFHDGPDNVVTWE